MKKYLLFLLLFSPLAFSGDWSQPLVVRDVYQLASHSPFGGGGYSQLWATFDSDVVSTTCPIRKSRAVYYTNTANTWTQVWLSELLAAQAQGKKVQIWIDRCGGGEIVLHGVKVIRD
ncbi:hypothetical protein M3P05_12505 [Sansalvadorimonas sp. 2012CJ34-2]|uniref:Uncharacterized protein n=1 Tax=Parendozoicomonas callyspongiae TaxID=2942213 RepID=A0ABT0PHE0_9GAMM|nr:hypothetical protein [Sansalvadorimonas sp. 2012CJ34-2]MCL6270745.1 hypothetical protein [Sansalvadorimonas sp. 2012CJ34-2]